jgi:hypothetical protein
MVESLSPTIRKNPLFLRVKPQVHKNPRVPPKRRQSQGNPLILPIPSLLLYPLLLMSAPRGRETMSKISARPNLLPKNLPQKKRAPSTPTPMRVLLARKSLFLVFVCLMLFWYSHIFALLLYCQVY